MRPASKPGLSLVRATRYGEILISEVTIGELRDVLNRARFRRYADYETVRLFLESLTSRARSVDVHIDITACRDPTDDKFLSLAVSGGATHIVTGDKDLLELDPFQGIRILTPSDLLASL